MEASERLSKYFKGKKEPNWTSIILNLVPFVSDVIKVIFENRKNNGKLKLIKLVVEIHGQDMNCADLIDRINKVLDQ